MGLFEVLEILSQVIKICGMVFAMILLIKIERNTRGGVVGKEEES